MFLNSLYCKQYGPRRGASLIRVYSVCFHQKIQSEVHLNICNRSKKQTSSGQKKNTGRIRVEQKSALLSLYRLKGETERVPTFHLKTERLLLFLFSNEMWVIRSVIYKLLVRTANKEDPDQTASSEALISVCTVYLGHFGRQVVFESLEHFP